MASVKMYTTQWCGYCAAARELLRSKGVKFEDIDVDADQALRQEMTEKSGGSTVPQVFINNKPVGGYTDIAALEQQGKLDELLSQEGTE
ncbi:MAG: glutaredoxin 3 [Gammaproteobacteria bacterium]